MQAGRHLLIDGHNILHAWEASRVLMMRSAEGARSFVVAAGMLIHDIEHLQVSVIFDGSGSEVGIEYPGSDTGCRALYAPKSMTADDLIEQTVGASDTPANFVVATGDRLERETIEALGAEWVSPVLLEEWVERCRMRQSDQIERRSKRQDQEWNNRLPL